MKVPKKCCLCLNQWKFPITRIRTGSLLQTDQTLKVLSSDAETNHFLSWLQPTELTAPSWPNKNNNGNIIKLISCINKYLWSCINIIMHNIKIHSKYRFQMVELKLVTVNQLLKFPTTKKHRKISLINKQKKIIPTLLFQSYWKSTCNKYLLKKYLIKFNQRFSMEKRIWVLYYNGILH